MKFVVVAVVVVLVLWLTLRSRRALPPRRRHAAAGPAAPAQPMVACAHCGVHLPRGDALADPQGRLYCGDAHRLAGPRGAGPGR